MINKTKTLASILLGLIIFSLSMGLVSAVEVSNSDISAIVSIINESGGIPLTVTTVTTTNWTQLWISILFSSFFILFFFGQMISGGIDNTAAKIVLKTMKRKTGKPILFIKHTQQGMFSGSMIDQDTVNKVSRALNEFEGKDFDLILHTPGGVVFSAMFISRLFKDYPGKITTIIPAYAMSGGTLLSLSTDEIYMARSACLGPVDPQLGSLFSSGSAKSWDHIVKFKGKKADDSSISMALTGEQYTKSIRDHLVGTIDFGLSLKQRKKLADFLTNGNIEHAHALTIDDLNKLGVPAKQMRNTTLIGKLIKIISKISSEGVTYIK